MDTNDLQNRFTYHSVDKDDESAMKQIRLMALNLAMLINDNVPEGREKSLAVTSLETSVFWANSGIARKK